MNKTINYQVIKEKTLLQAIWTQNVLRNHHGNFPMSGKPLPSKNNLSLWELGMTVINPIHAAVSNNMILKIKHRKVYIYVTSGLQILSFKSLCILHTSTKFKLFKKNCKFLRYRKWTTQSDIIWARWRKACLVNYKRDWGSAVDVWKKKKKNTKQWKAEGARNWTDRHT